MQPTKITKQDRIDRMIRFVEEADVAKANGNVYMPEPIQGCGIWINPHQIDGAIEILQEAQDFVLADIIEQARKIHGFDACLQAGMLVDTVTLGAIRKEGWKTLTKEDLLKPLREAQEEESEEDETNDIRSVRIFAESDRGYDLAAEIVRKMFPAVDLDRGNSTRINDHANVKTSLFTAAHVEPLAHALQEAGVRDVIRAPHALDANNKWTQHHAILINVPDANLPEQKVEDSNEPDRETRREWLQCALHAVKRANMDSSDKLLLPYAIRSHCGGDYTFHANSRVRIVRKLREKNHGTLAVLLEQATPKGNYIGFAQIIEAALGRSLSLECAGIKEAYAVQVLEEELRERQEVAEQPSRAAVNWDQTLHTILFHVKAAEVGPSGDISLPQPIQEITHAPYVLWNAEREDVVKKLRDRRSPNLAGLLEKTEIPVGGFIGTTHLVETAVGRKLDWDLHRDAKACAVFVLEEELKIDPAYQEHLSEEQVQKIAEEFKGTEENATDYKAAVDPVINELGQIFQASKHVGPMPWKVGTALDMSRLARYRDAPPEKRTRLEETHHVPTFSRAVSWLAVNTFLEQHRRMLANETPVYDALALKAAEEQLAFARALPAWNFSPPQLSNSGKDDRSGDVQIEALRRYIAKSPV